MDETPFSELAELCEQLEQTRKRRDLTSLLAVFLQTLSPEEIPPAVRLTIGRVFAEWDERTLNMSWKSVMAVVDDLTNASPEARDEIWAQAVD